MSLIVLASTCVRTCLVVVSSSRARQSARRAGPLSAMAATMVLPVPSPPSGRGSGCLSRYTAAAGPRGRTSAQRQCRPAPGPTPAAAAPCSPRAGLPCSRSGQPGSSHASAGRRSAHVLPLQSIQREVIHASTGHGSGSNQKSTGVGSCSGISSPQHRVPLPTTGGRPPEFRVVEATRGHREIRPGNQGREIRGRKSAAHRRATGGGRSRNEILPGTARPRT